MVSVPALLVLAAQAPDFTRNTEGSQKSDRESVRRVACDSCNSVEVIARPVAAIFCVARLTMNPSNTAENATRVVRFTACARSQA